MANFVIRRKNCEMLWGIGIMNLKLIQSIKMRKNESEKVSEEKSGREGERWRETVRMRVREKGRERERE